LAALKSCYNHNYWLVVCVNYGRRWLIKSVPGREPAAEAADADRQDELLADADRVGQAHPVSLRKPGAYPTKHDFHNYGHDLKN
jgi:hypothetical protein